MGPILNVLKDILCDVWGLAKRRLMGRLVGVDVLVVVCGFDGWWFCPGLCFVILRMSKGFFD